MSGPKSTRSIVEFEVYRQFKVFFLGILGMLASLPQDF